MQWLKWPTLSRPFVRIRQPWTLTDLVVALSVLALLAAMVYLGGRMTAAAVPEEFEIHLDLIHVPYYALRSVARAFIAFSWTLLFTFVYGSLAAHSAKAERILMPLLDILQSVPVLGFLSVTITAFMALFPGSVLGLELASIFAIFTSQAWNMAYSFFQSVRAIPRDLIEAAQVMRLSPFQRFVRLEVPFAMNGLVWNAMVSFGGGWFFLAASEAITVLNQDIRLPGIGSYLATAVEAGDFRYIAVSIATMLAVILLLDFLFFRPLLAWSQKFAPAGTLDEGTESRVLTALQRSQVVTGLNEKVLQPIANFFVHRLPARFRREQALARTGRQRRAFRWVLRFCGAAAGLILVVWAAIGVRDLAGSITALQVLGYLLDGLFTFVRVLACVAFASLVWVPIGVAIGMRPALAQRLRPVIQIGAAFPANLAYPVLTYVFIVTGLDIGAGSVFLMVLGSQWYILFNVVVGTLSIPEDLKEVGRVMRLTRWQAFRNIVAPVVMPYWVTGAITAAGGAWNASIVAEVATLGDHTLVCRGLGASMTEATRDGDWPGILLTIVIMCAFVVATNRLVWRRLYDFAEEHLRLEA